MKKFLVTIVVVAIVAVAAIWAVKTFIKPEEVVMAEILPRDVAFYYSVQNIESMWKDIETSRFWKDLTGLKLWSDIQVASGLSDLKAQFKENTGLELSEENLMKLVGKELVIAITPGAEATAPPKILLLCRGKSEKSLSGVIDPIIARVKENDPTRIEETEYLGIKITHIKAVSADQPEIYTLLLEEILIVGVGDTLSEIHQIVDISGGKSKETLAGTENFKKITKLIGNTKKELAGLFYMDFTGMRKYLQALTLPGPEGASTQVATGMETINFIGGWTEIKNGLITKLYIYPNTEALDPQMKKMWEASPQVPETLKFIPEKTLLYIVSSSIDLPAMWQLWQKNVKAQTPEQAQPILENIENFQKEWEIDLETEVFPLVGNEVAFIFADINTEGLMPIPKLGLAIKVKDKEKVDKVIADMILKNNEKAVAEAESAVEKEEAQGSEETATETPAEGEEEAQEAEGLTPASIRFQINLIEESYEDNQIKTLQLPLVGTGLAPGYMYLDSFLIIGATTKTLHEIIDVTKGKLKPLTYDPMYQKIAKILPQKANQASYINMERLMEIGIGICNWVVSFQQLSMPQGPPPEDPAEAELFNQRKAQVEATIATINDNVIPLLKTFKAIKIVATTTVNKPDYIEEIIVIRIEDI